MDSSVHAQLEHIIQIILVFNVNPTVNGVTLMDVYNVKMDYTSRMDLVSLVLLIVRNVQPLLVATCVNKSSSFSKHPRNASLLGSIGRMSLSIQQPLCVLLDVLNVME